MAVEAELEGDVAREDVAREDVARARQALARGELAPALYLVSAALASDPTHREWRALLDEVLARTADPTMLVLPADASADFVTAATRAYVLASQRRYLEAIATVCDVAAARPDRAHLTWASEWARIPGVAPSIPSDAIAQRIVPPLLRALTGCPSPCPAEDPRRMTCDAAIELLGALYSAHPRDGMVVFAASVALRRVGRFAEAIQYASYALQLRNDWTSCVGVANALRDAGRVDEAVQYYRHALAMRPDELSPLLDAGDALLDAERWDDAIATYHEVLAKRGGDGWATASIAYAEWKRTGESSSREALWRMAERNTRASALLRAAVGDQPYFTWLPGPGDFTAHAARRIVRQLSMYAPSAELDIDVAIDHLEAPSALTAYQLWARARGFTHVDVTVRVAAVQQPDPRVPKAPVDFQLWAYDGTAPRPTVPAPDARVHAAITEIADTPYCLPMWEARVRDLAGQTGAPWMHLLLSALVRPPPLPSPQHDPFVWVQKCQIATAMVIAYLDGSPWEGSQRRRALTSIAFGPTDWICDAAIVAMGWLATKDAAVRREVEAIFARLEALVPQQGFTCWEYPLASVWRNLGGHEPETAARLDAWKQRCEARRAERAVERHGGLTLEEYAELSALRNAILMELGAPADGASAVDAAALAELQALFRRFGLPAPASAAGARVPGWDARLHDDPELARRFVALEARFALMQQGRDRHQAPSCPPRRVR